MMMCKWKYWCAKEQKSKLKQYWDEVGRLDRLYTDGLCTAAAIGKLLIYLMAKGYQNWLSSALGTENKRSRFLSVVG